MSNHMNYQKTQEVQATCPHGKEWVASELSLNKWRTGDKICKRCGYTFPRTEQPLPVEYRSQMIVTAHALLVAANLNDDLELQYDPNPPMCKFAWALVSKSTGHVKIGVACDVAEDCVARGLIAKVDYEPPPPPPRGRRRKQWF